MEQPGNRSQEQTSPYEDYPDVPSRTETMQSTRELRADLSASELGETVVVSQPQTGADEIGQRDELPHEAWRTAE